MNRLGLIEEEVLLPVEGGFLLCEEEGIGKVTLVSIIGKGGTAIAYKGIRVRNGSAVTCIVKEYFPEEKEKHGIYSRKKMGDPVRIAERYREEEWNLQMENIRRELKTNQEIYLQQKGGDYNNSPYAYHAEYLCRLGDASYLVLDTSEGETLQERIRKGSLRPEETFRMLRQLLVLVENLNEKGFVHCDIKPSNLWLRGEEENQSMCLLDFGSAFRLQDYQRDLSSLTPEQIMEAADEIIRNESIGTNTREYCSCHVARVESHKSIYSNTDHSLERARKLLSALNDIRLSDDLFSVVKVGETMLANTVFTEDEKNSIQEIREKIWQKNENQGYETVGELYRDIEILDTILQKGAHPAVLENGIRKTLEALPVESIRWDLLCEIQ